MENLEQGFDDDRFVNVVIDEDLHCAICLNVLKRPVQCQNNEHHFCKPCIERHLQYSQTCPSCKERLTLETLRKPARYLTRHLSKLNIHCDYADSGCEEVLQLEHLKTHTNSCGFTPVMCCNSGCGLVVNKQDKYHHETEDCPFRLVWGSDYEVLRQERDELWRNQERLETEIKKLKKQLSLLNVRTKDCGDSRDMRGSKNEDIIIAGGRGNDSRLNSVEKFSWTTQRWEQMSSMNVIRSGASSVCYENQMIVVGGRNEPGVPNIHNTIETLNLNENSPRWCNFPTLLPIKYADHQCVVFKDRLFIIGGRLGDYHSYDTIYEVLLVPPYTITLKARMLQKRQSHGAALVGHKILILGGESVKDHVLDSVEIYDIHENECRLIPPLPLVCSRMGTVSCGNNVILVGGMDENCRNVSSVVMYNVNGESTFLPPMKHKAVGCAAVITGNKLIVMGGDDGEALNSTQFFSFDQYSWGELPPLNEARAFATAIVKPGV